MTTLLAGFVELDVPPTEQGGGCHQGAVQPELELVDSVAGLAVVGDVRLVRLGGAADVGRAQDLSASGSEVLIEVVAGDAGPLASQPFAVVDVEEVPPETVLHATRHREIRLGIGIGWRDD